MAKQGMKDEAARQELIAELNQLNADNLKADGEPRKDAVPQELNRIDEINTILADGSGGGGEKEKVEAPELPYHDPEADDDGPATESDAAKIKRLTAENVNLKAAKARSAGANKIKSVGKKIGYVPRPDEIMLKSLDDAENRSPEDWDESNKLAVERTIRRFVRKGGAHKDLQKGGFYDLAAGFKKGLALAEKIYAIRLLNLAGRLKCRADVIIKQLEKREKMTVGELNNTNAVFNEELEGLGVSWDDNIQVPGMSQQLRS